MEGIVVVGTLPLKSQRPVVSIRSVLTAISASFPVEYHPFVLLQKTTHQA